MDQKKNEKETKRQRLSPKVMSLLSFGMMLKDYQTDIPVREKTKKPKK